MHRILKHGKDKKRTTSGPDRKDKENEVKRAVSSSSQTTGLKELAKVGQHDRMDSTGSDGWTNVAAEEVDQSPIRNRTASSGPRLVRPRSNGASGDLSPPTPHADTDRRQRIQSGDASLIPTQSLSGEKLRVFDGVKKMMRRTLSLGPSKEAVQPLSNGKDKDLGSPTFQSEQAQIEDSPAGEDESRPEQGSVGIDRSVVIEPELRMMDEPKGAPSRSDTGQSPSVELDDMPMPGSFPSISTLLKGENVPKPLSPTVPPKAETSPTRADSPNADPQEMTLNTIMANHRELGRQAALDVNYCTRLNVPLSPEDIVVKERERKGLLRILCNENRSPIERRNALDEIMIYHFFDMTKDEHERTLAFMEAVDPGSPRESDLWVEANGSQIGSESSDVLPVDWMDHNDQGHLGTEPTCITTARPPRLWSGILPRRIPDPNPNPHVWNLQNRSTFGKFPPSIYIAVARHLFDESQMATFRALTATSRDIHDTLDYEFKMLELNVEHLSPLLTPSLNTDRLMEEANDWPLPNTPVRPQDRATLLSNLSEVRRVNVKKPLPVSYDHLLHSRNECAPLRKVKRVAFPHEFFLHIGWMRFRSELSFDSVKDLLGFYRHAFAPSYSLCLQVPWVHHTRNLERYCGERYNGNLPAARAEQRRWWNNGQENVWCAVRFLCGFENINCLTLHGVEIGQQVDVHRYNDTIVEFLATTAVHFLYAKDSPELEDGICDARRDTLYSLARSIYWLPTDFSGKITLRNFHRFCHPTSRSDDEFRQFGAQNGGRCAFYHEFARMRVFINGTDGELTTPEWIATNLARVYRMIDVGQLVFEATDTAHDKCAGCDRTSNEIYSDVTVSKANVAAPPPYGKAGSAAPPVPASAAQVSEVTVSRQL